MDAVLWLELSDFTRTACLEKEGTAGKEEVGDAGVEERIEGGGGGMEGGERREGERSEGRRRGGGGGRR